MRKVEQGQILDDLKNKDSWIFDLDNTLYPRSCNLFHQVDRLIGEYISAHLKLDKADARKLQKDYFQKYGTSLKGLMIHHNVEPRAFLNFVHDIDYSPVQPDPELVKAITALPGKKYIYTNADLPHVEAVLRRLNMSNLFDGVYDILDADLVPKPDEEAFQNFLNHFDIDQGSAVMFEDMIKNLKTAKLFGVSTVYIAPDPDFDTSQLAPFEYSGDIPSYVDYSTFDLVFFLKNILEK